ncbi:MAG: C-GCAxxG-C-C family protein, partial [Firmicutes bacterium]|nr:C-GCAxxG-C-C family protein [Bacillota bacterium]
FQVDYSKDVLYLLSGFSGGIGFTGELCGALCGGIAAWVTYTGVGSQLRKKPISAF